MEKEEQHLYIDICNKFMRGNQHSTQDKFVYMILKSMSFSNNKSYNGIAPFSTEIILSMIGFSLNSKNKNSIKESIDSLIKAEEIDVYEDFLGNVKVDSIQLSKTYFVRVNKELTGNYTRIYLNEAYQIITMDDKNKAKIFAVFMEIVSYIYVNDKSDHYCFPNIETIEECTGINRKTIMKYVQQLFENKLLYYKTYKKGKSKDKNIYSRWEDKQEVIDYLDFKSGA